jgi:hypothetical protein
MQPFAQMPTRLRAGQAFDMSDADLSADLGLVASNGQISIEFFYRMIRLTDPSNPSVHGEHKTVLCVRKRPHGDRHTEQVKMISERTAQALYPREFAYFKQHHDVPTDGTPLHELPGITQSQIAILVIHNIRSVEDLVNLEEDRIAQIGMDARKAFTLARKWDEARKSNTDLIANAQKEAAANAEIERMRKAEAQHIETIARLTAQVELLMRQGATGMAAHNVPIGQTAVAIDNDDGVVEAPDTGLFQGVQMVSGNDDLMGDDPPPPAALPGLGRRRG